MKLNHESKLIINLNLNEKATQNPNSKQNKCFTYLHNWHWLPPSKMNVDE